MDYLSAEYVICFMVCDCDIVLLLSDQCIAGTYMGIIQIYCIYFIWNDFYSNFCVYFVFYHRWSVRCLSEWITVFNVLYQFIYFSGICVDISGYEGFTVLCNPYQDEVDGDCICCSCGILWEEHGLWHCQSSHPY